MKQQAENYARYLKEVEDAKTSLIHAERSLASANQRLTTSLDNLLHAAKDCDGRRLFNTAHGVVEVTSKEVKILTLE